MSYQQLHKQQQKSQRRWNQLLTVFLAALVVQQMYAFVAKDQSPADLWWSRDQQAWQQWFLGDYNKAADLFENSELKAYSFYAGGQFDKAAKISEHIHTAPAYFAWGNALAHMERYEEAIVAYEMAAAMRSNWAENTYNLELVRVLANKPEQKRDKGDDSHSDIGADEVRFDLKDQDASQQIDDPLADGDLGKEAVQQLWLRRLNRKPVDFLQRKFSYQLQMQAAQDSQSASKAGSKDPGEAQP